MRKCIRCGEEMIEGGTLDSGWSVIGFRLNKRFQRNFPVCAAVCPNCHEVSVFMKDKVFDEMTGKALKETKI